MIAETMKTTITMLSDGGQIVRDDRQDVPGCIAGIWGTDRSDFVARGEGFGTLGCFWIAFCKGLRAFERPWVRFGVGLVVFGLPLRAFGSIAGHRRGTQSALRQTVAAN